MNCRAFGLQNTSCDLGDILTFVALLKLFNLYFIQTVKLILYRLYEEVYLMTCIIYVIFSFDIVTLGDQDICKGIAKSGCPCIHHIERTSRIGAHKFNKYSFSCATLVVGSVFRTEFIYILKRRI